MSMPQDFLNELRARMPAPVLIGRQVRLQRSGRVHKGCCPFHGEKTPSFYVYDDHFHCFGCGEHGDTITFMMRSQGLSFIEAVQSLAAEGGLEVPKTSPAEAEREAKRANLQEVLAAAARVYQAWLFEPAGAAGLAYLRQRGLTEAAIKKFGLGWSGEGRGALAQALRRNNITTEQLVEAGLMKQGDHGPVDMFFSRVMFPILDRRGAIVSFSGRILDDGQPKYVNGPETPVFSKRRSLYGVNFAREAVRKGEPLIIVEGQMDAIALSQAGFGGAVAPLGTALTEEQLTEIWRLSPEPVLCFDADKAGRRAALRVVELALGGLAPDRSLKFLRLPDSQDPDSLIRTRGPAAFTTLLASAQPLSAVLYDMLAEGGNRGTPEGRAAFRNRLLEVVGLMKDRTLAAEYRSVLLDRFFAERPSIAQSNRPTTGSRRARIPGQQVRPSIDPAVADIERGYILTAILINHPTILAEVEEAYATLDLPPPCGRLREAFSIFTADPANNDLQTLPARLVRYDVATDVSNVLAKFRLPACALPNATLAEATEGWWEMFGLMTTSRKKLRQQRDEQQRRYLESPEDQAVVEKLVRLNLALLKTERAD